MAEQSPAAQMAERASEVIPGLGAAAFAVGLENHRRTLHDHAQRLRTDYKIGLRALGVQDDLATSQPSEDDMGDIVICGDITNNIDGRTSPTATKPATDASPRPGVSDAAKSGLSGLAKAAVIGSALLGSGGIGAGVLALLRPVAQATATNAEAGARVHVYWDDVEIKPGQSASAEIEKGSE